MKPGPASKVRSSALRWLTLGLWGGGLVLMLVVGALVWRGIASAEQTEALRHEVIATRVFDEMERELTVFVSNEDARPFTHYRETFVPEGGEVARASPLSKLPEHPAVLAYVQVERPDLDPEITLPLSVEAQAERTPAQVTATQRAMAALGFAEAPDEPPTPAITQRQGDDPPPQQQIQMQAQSVGPEAVQQEVAIQQALNSGADVRNDRQSKIFNPSGNSLDNFNDPQVAGANLLEVAPQSKKKKGPGTTLAVQDDEVVVAPFEVEVDGELLVMHRRVGVGNSSFEQVIVLDSEALLQALGDAVLSRGELARYASLVDRSGPPDPERFEYEHVFAAPFSMVGRLALRKVPGPGAYASMTLWIMGAVVLVVLVAGLAVLQRAVTATVSYAEQRNDFVSAVTHELRTPLTTIRMYAEMLEADMVPPQRRAEYLSTMREQAERLGGLVEDVLAMAKLEKRDGSEVGSAIEPLSDVVHGVVSMLEPQAKEQDVRLRVELGREVAEQRVVAPAIERILTNLMGNAVKFAPGGEVSLEAREEAGELVLLVQDEGPGVAPELLTTIFEPFYRAERELTRNTQGTGIGLSLVARIVETMEGTVQARNREPNGLAVEIRLPTATRAK